MPTVPRNDTPSAIFDTPIEMPQALKVGLSVASSQTAHVRGTEVLVENAPQGHAPQAVADPLGPQRSQFKVRSERRRK